MTNTTEVVVAGGGIAAAASCIALGRIGLRPLWIRPAQQHAHVGDSLAPAARPLLRELGMEHLLENPAHRPSNTTFSSWGTPALVERHAMVHLEGHGHVVDRQTLQRALDEAAQNFACLRTGSLSFVHAYKQGWRIQLEDESQVDARLIIDATGRQAKLARRLGNYRRLDNQVAAVATLTQQDETVTPTPATVIEAVEDGWWYAALRSDCNLTLIYFSDPDLLPAGLSRTVSAWEELIAKSTYIARWLDDAGFAVDTPPRLVTAGTTWAEPPCGATSGGAPWAAVGDAAAAFDPLSSHGMTSALWCALRVARLAPDLLAGNLSGLGDYAAAVHRGVDNFLSERAALYSREQRFARSLYWRRRAA